MIDKSPEVKEYEKMLKGESKKLILGCIKKGYDADLCVEHAVKYVITKTEDMDGAANPYLQGTGRYFPNTLLIDFNNEFKTTVPEFKDEDYLADTIFDKVNFMTFATYLQYKSNENRNHKKIFDEWKTIQESNVKNGLPTEDFTSWRMPKHIEEIVDKYDWMNDKENEKWWWDLKEQYHALIHKKSEIELKLEKEYIKENNLETDREDEYKKWYDKEMREAKQRYLGQMENYRLDKRRRKPEQPTLSFSPDVTHFENIYHTIIRRRIPNNKTDEIERKAKNEVYPDYKSEDVPEVEKFIKKETKKLFKWRRPESTLRKNK